MFLEVIPCPYPQGSAGFSRDYLIKIVEEKRSKVADSYSHVRL